MSAMQRFEVHESFRAQQGKQFQSWVRFSFLKFFIRDHLFVRSIEDEEEIKFIHKEVCDDCENNAVLFR